MNTDTNATLIDLAGRKRPVANLTDKERRLIAVCFHESGHAVAGVLLGGVVKSVVVNMLAEPHGYTTFSALDKDRYSQMTFAGPWVEARWSTGRRPGARELFAVLADHGHLDDKVLSAAGGISSECDALVPSLERCWESVGKVARLLFKAREAKHAHVCAALGVPAENNAHHLAAIRSGSVPGTFTITQPLPPPTACHCH